MDITSKEKAGQAAGALSGDRNFRWLMAGALISMLGDQFTLIALPWLVLKMTGDTLVLGTVLAVAAVPRALFILVGGALVDRYSPKQVMVLTKHANTVLLAALAALLMADQLTLWMVYGFALAIGLATAFSIPAGTSIMPHVVRREQLNAANGMLMSVRQFSVFAGPLLAGLLIALFGSGGGGTITDAKGLSAAFLFDALSFALSAWTLSRVRVHAEATAASGTERSSVLQAVAEGLRYCWNDRALRSCFLYWGVVAFFISGPIHIALPVLASQMEQGAAAFGFLMGAHGAGTLAGMAVSGIRPNLRLRTFGSTILAVDAVVGLLFIPLGLIQATWQGAMLLIVIGILTGFLQVAVYTWLQRHMKPAMLGRGMSLFMFIFLGIAPISAAITGWIMRSVTLPQLFAASGALLVVIVATAYLRSDMHRIVDPATN